MSTGKKIAIAAAFAVCALGVFAAVYVLPGFLQQSTRPAPQASNENMEVNANSASLASPEETAVVPLGDMNSNAQANGSPVPPGDAAQTEVPAASPQPAAPADPSREQPIAVETPPEYVARSEKLKSLDKDAIAAKAVDVVSKLRNFNNHDYESVTGWQSRFAENADLSRAADYEEKNILYQETLPKWIEACATYPEYWAATDDIRVLNVYMDTVDASDVPCVGIVTVEQENEDYPYALSEHWKPIDRVQKTYIVYLTEDGSRVYNVKMMDRKVLEKNIYHHWYDSDMSHSTEDYWASRR